MQSIHLLKARTDLAEAIVASAAAQLQEARERPQGAWSRSLVEGCEAGLAMRQAEAAALRAELAERQAA